MSFPLNHYRLLGRSGLRVSPLCLGTMTFGTEWGWGSDEKTSRKILDMYAERGGNFIDTANEYTNGTSEKFLGKFLKDRRDDFIVATKYSMNVNPKDPNAGGNSRNSMLRSVEESLKRLDTDYIDLLWLHIRDRRTPWDEIMRAFDDLVRMGKVNYIGVSDTPAWEVAHANTMAELRGWTRFAGLQIEYSLIERTGERDLIPMAREFGLGVTPWSPLASGLLTGKYSREDLPEGANPGTMEGSRKNVIQTMNRIEGGNSRAFDIVDTVRDVAVECGRSMAQVALNWNLQQPGVTSPIIGARTLDQLEDNLGALDFDLDEDQRARLDAASDFPLGFPHDFLNRVADRAMNGETVVEMPRRAETRPGFDLPRAAE